MRTINKISIILLVTLLCVISALSIFELMYRHQTIDTFNAELKYYNQPSVLDNSLQKDTVLILGDSFTAGSSNYPAIMQDWQNKYRIVNSAIPGTGILEALLIAPRRFKQFNPDIFIYQVYVGNDLYNIHYPVNWDTITPVRNIYWSIAQSFRSIWYLNYKNGQIAYALKEADTLDLPTENAKKLDLSCEFFEQLQLEHEPFSPDKYTLRDKIILKAEPWILENQIMIRRNRKKDYDLFLVKLKELLSYCEMPKCRAYVLVIPHAVQVNQHYIQDMQQLGAKFSNPNEILSDEYPFIKNLRVFIHANGLKNIQILNPIKDLRRSEAAGKSVYHQNDSHLNPYGQGIIAKFTLDKIGVDKHCQSIQ